MNSTYYAHAAGRTSIFSMNNDIFLSSGAEGQLKLWNKYEVTARISVGKNCTAMATANDIVYVANELNELMQYCLFSIIFKSKLKTFSSKVTIINLTKNNIICGLEEMAIIILDLKRIILVS